MRGVSELSWDLGWSSTAYHPPKHQLCGVQGLGLRAGPACLYGQRSKEVGDDPFVSLPLSLPLILLRQFNKDIVWPNRPDPKCKQIQAQAPSPILP